MTSDNFWFSDREPTPVFDQTVEDFAATTADTAEQHRRWIDPDSRDGAAIIELFIRIKAVEHSDGSWSGAEVVDQLCQWLTTVGIDPDDTPDAAVQRLRQHRP